MGATVGRPWKGQLASMDTLMSIQVQPASVSLECLPYH